MNTDEIDQALKAARDELAAAMAALAPRHKGGEWERFEAAHDRCLALERDLARAVGDECAVEIEWPARWDVGAPLPHVLASGDRTRLVYLMSEPDPEWNGSYATVVDPSSAERQAIAIVQFEGCLVHKLGAPNDEVLAGHPLYGHGLVAYRAHVVERSHWIREHERINSVHPRHTPGWENVFRHYVLVFHDETFECIARSHSVKTVLCSFAEALQESVRELVS